MATRWEGDSLLVKMSGVLQLCCERPAWPATTLQAPPPPALSSLLPGYTNSHLSPWSAIPLLSPEGPRYTILPTISVVSPWDEDHDYSNVISDQVFGDSNSVVQVITPTPVLPPLPATPVQASQPSWVGEAAHNATHRFYDVLRAVLHGNGHASAPALREDTRSGVEVAPAGVSPHIQESPIPQYDPAISPLIQVCAVLAVLVLVMVLLFHSHHFRRDCVTERRVLRRVARHYHVTRARDNLEKNESVDVPDVTL